jgi:hypothetical protein
MTDLTQQLEDKKKELNSIDKRLTNLYKQNRLKQYAELFNKYAIRKAEIAILEQAIAEIEKQRHEEIEFLQWIYSNNGVEEDFDNVMISIDNRIYRLKEQQLNQPKTEKSKNETFKYKGRLNKLW